MSTVQPRHRSVKTYGHERGFSCCFRQHKATHSHCSKLHGYALAFELTFESTCLDERNWVMDFGGLKEVEQFLKDTFDHTTVLAEHDPVFEHFHDLHLNGVVNLVGLEEVGCEAFAEHVYHTVRDILHLWCPKYPVKLVKVKVMEHGSNAAEYEVPYDSQTT